MYADRVKISDTRMNDVSCRGTLRNVRQNYANSQIRTMGVRCLQLRPIPDDGNIAVFTSKTFAANGYTEGNFGHFNAMYLPLEKKLNIDLPVFFMDGFPEEYANYFIDNVKRTWSEKYKMQTKVDTPAWKSALNDVNVFVQAEEAADKDSAYFKITYDPDKRCGHGEDKVGAGTARLSGRGHDQTEEAWAGNSNTNVYGHEAGHMFGLGDEYGPVGGTEKATHYDLTEEAFDKAYADDNAVRNGGKTFNAIMGNRTIVRKHHYVTFWAAMVQAIQKGSPDSTKAPNERSDWEIV